MVAGRAEAADESFHFELVLKGRPSPSDEGDDEVLTSWIASAGSTRSGEPVEVSTYERSLLSFQRPVPS